MTKVIVFVGTVMGTAQGVAEALTRRLNEIGHNSRIELAPRAQDLLDNKDALWLFCSSNTGAGDLPDNIQPFYQQLTQTFPAISGQHYRMIILGDSCYPTFAEAGHRLDAALADIGAIRDGDALVLDAMSGEDPQAQALNWLDTWIETL